MADRRGVGLLDAYRQYVGDPFASMVGGAARGYLGLDKPTYANEEAYRTAQAIGNIPGFGAPAGVFKAAANAPEVIAALGGLLGKPGVGKAVKKLKAPQDEALETARKNAVKMLGLPENNSAMDRAKALGFNESGFTGTNKDFRLYDASKAQGSGSGSREGALGAWLTDDPRVASTFADWSARGMGGNVIYPLMIRGSKPYEVSAYSEIKDIVDANTKFRRPPYRMMQDEIDYEAAKRAIAEKGDYLALRNTATDSIDAPITQYLVPDTSRLRSRFAAFDPARINDNDLLGFADPRLLALIAAGTGGGLLGYNYSQDQ
jgi:hypothetical protein